MPLFNLARCSKKKTKKNSKEDIGKPYVSHSPVKLPLVNGNSSLANSQAPSLNGSAYGNAGVPKIPRATTTTSSWDSRTNLEMVPSNSRQNLISVDRNSVSTALCEIVVQRGAMWEST